MGQDAPFKELCLYKLEALIDVCSAHGVLSEYENKTTK